MRMLYIFLYYFLYFLVGHSNSLKLLSIFGLTKKIIQVTLPNSLKLSGSLFDIFIIVKEIYAENIYEIFDDFQPKKNDVVIDIGAQIGAYSLKSAKQVGENGLIISVEPHPENRRISIY